MIQRIWGADPLEAEARADFTAVLFGLMSAIFLQTRFFVASIACYFLRGIRESPVATPLLEAR